MWNYSFVYTRFFRRYRLVITNTGAAGLFVNEKENIKRAEITILGELPDNDIYDFILLTVRENQLYEALFELKNNKSDTIVTMVNSLDSYKKWEDIEACSYPISGSKGYAYVAAVSPCHGSTDCRCIL